MFYRETLIYCQFLLHKRKHDQQYDVVKNNEFRKTHFLSSVNICILYQLLNMHSNCTKIKYILIFWISMVLLSYLLDLMSIIVSHRIFRHDENS